MRIEIVSEGRNIKIPVPNFLAFNKASVFLGRRFLGKEAAEIEPEKLRALFRELRRFSKKYPHFLLLEAEGDGSAVRIYL